MGKQLSRASSRDGARAGRAGGGGRRRRRAQPDARGRRARGPLGAGVTVFHIGDVAPVDKLMARVHARRGGKRRSSTGAARGGRGARATRRGDHPPLYLTDSKHLVGVAGSLAGAKVLRDFIRETLGDAVEHVQTEFVKAPRSVGGARSGLRRRR